MLVSLLTPDFLLFLPLNCPFDHPSDLYMMIGRLHVLPVRVLFLFHLSQTRQLVYDMIPETTENKRFSERALLPFVGDLSKSIFGIATENDVRVLAGHINALTRQKICCVREVALRRNIDLPRMNPIFRRKLYIYLSLEKYSII
jgi:hypothetical protein